MTTSTEAVRTLLDDPDEQVRNQAAMTLRFLDHPPVEVSSEDVAAGKPQALLEVAAREGRAEDEGWRVRKDGSRFWANVVITVIYDEQHNHVGFAKVTRDLTERRAAEEALCAERASLEKRVEEPKLLQLFLDEARIVAQLSHPHIVGSTR